MALQPSATPSTTPLSLFFSGGGAPHLGLNGQTVSTSVSGGNVYSSNNNQFIVGFLNKPQGGPKTPDVLYTVIQDYVNNTGTIYVDGDRTPTGALAGLPTATYSGASNFMNAGGNWSTGTASIDINFGTGAVSGSLTGYPQDTGAALNLAPTTLSGNTFTTTLSSPTLTVTSSQLSGGLFGTTAGSLAGTVMMSTPTTSSIGLFGAVN